MPTPPPAPAPDDPPPGLASRLNTERSPHLIRQALPPDRREVFEAHYRRAITDAADTYDLTGVHELIDRWLAEAILHATGRYQTAMRRADDVKRGQGPKGPANLDRLAALADTQR